MLDDLGETRVQARESAGQRQLSGEANFAASDQFRLVRGTGDDGPSGASGSRVDTQDPPTVRQDAASETASSSKERFA